MPSPLAEKAIDLISPSVGDFIATAKVRAACRLADVDIEKLDASNLQEFTEQFEKICATGLGGKISESLTKRLIGTAYEP